MSLCVRWDLSKEFAASCLFCIHRIIYLGCFADSSLSPRREFSTIFHRQMSAYPGVANPTLILCQLFAFLPDTVRFSTRDRIIRILCEFPVAPGASPTTRVSTNNDVFMIRCRILYCIRITYYHIINFISFYHHIYMCIVTRHTEWVPVLERFLLSSHFVVMSHNV